jgi:hypothetical protein
MRRRTVVAGLATATALLSLALPVTPANASSDYRIVTLSGANEAPGPGDEDGVGIFAWKVRGWKLCYVVTAQNVDHVHAAHIHRAPRGKPGPILVTLKAPAKGFASGCVKAVRRQTASNAARVLTRAELRAIVRAPRFYYANVHTMAFPAGAIRGQLAGPSSAPPSTGPGTGPY